MARNKLLAYWLAQLTRGSIPPLWSIRGKYGAVGVGGVTLGCVAHYQPKADVLGQIVPTILTQYRNWANPGTCDATLGTAPAWDAAVGWTFTTALMQYLKTGVVPAAGWSMVVRFSGGDLGASCILCGLSMSAANKRFYLSASLVGRHYYAYGTSSNGLLPSLAAGTMAVCATSCYLNGSPDGTITSTWTNTGAQVLLGAYNIADPGPAAAGFFHGIIPTITIYNVPLTAADNANLHADYVTWGL